jgi:hypothetical protein
VPSSSSVSQPSQDPKSPNCTINTCTPGLASPPRSYLTETHASPHFGKSLAKELGITWNLSTAYHPQTDGLTERTNQKVEQFLRLISANQEDWSSALPIATLIHNNSENAITKTSPNLLLIEREPPATPSQAVGSTNPTAEQRVHQLREQRIMATQVLNRAAKKHGPPRSKMETRAAGLARSKESIIALWDCQTSPQEAQTCPHQKGRLPCGVSAAPPSTMGDTPHFPCIPTNPIHRNKRT